MKKKNVSGLSMFKDNLGFPMNSSSQNYRHVPKSGRVPSNVKAKTQRGSGTHYGGPGAGGGPGGGQMGGGEAEGVL